MPFALAGGRTEESEWAGGRGKKASSFFNQYLWNRRLIFQTGSPRGRGRRLRRRSPHPALAPPPFRSRRPRSSEGKRPHCEAAVNLGGEYLKGVLVARLQIGRNVPELLSVRRENFDVTQRLEGIELEKGERERERGVKFLPEE
jgi:hypothetical protein